MSLEENILEGLAEGLVAVDAEGRVTVFNQAAEKMAGVSRSQVMGRTVAGALEGWCWIDEILAAALREGRCLTGREGELVRRRGGVVPVSVTTSQVIDEEGRVCGASALIKDLSGKKGLEEETLRRDRLAHLGAFALNMAHEIKNPLGGIRGAAQLLSRKVDAALSDYTDLIVRESDRLSRILDEVLDFARPREPDLRPMNVHKVLDSVLLIVEGLGRGEEGEEPPFRIVKEYDPSLPEVLGDEKLLVQVFLNLVKNAVEAVGDDGEVRVVTRMVTDFHLLEEGSGDARVAVDIIDNGCGIAADDIEKIFTPFYTTKSGGSGLGMAISFRIVKEHGGFFRIESARGGGTKVTVCLPEACASE
ncbi:MAG TPA: PAS domain S-box protein [Deltaproteobacteria bacterium]|nr:PAS domain S-box protein [Deltaproteobacteria bacterium]